MKTGSLIQRQMARALIPLMLVFSFFIFLRGHNAPGGGFAAGLTAAFPYLYYTYAYDLPSARAKLWLPPEHILGAGLLILLASAAWPLAAGKTFLEAAWADFSLSLGILELKPGTPVLFDLGVYLVSMGAGLVILFAIRGDIGDRRGH